MDGKDVEMAAHLGVKALGMLQAGGIFLGGDDAAGRWQLCKGLVDMLDVLFLEKVVVAIGEGSEVADGGRKVVHHLFG